MRETILSRLTQSAVVCIAIRAFLPEHARAQEVATQSMLGEVVVTARRRDESLQNTPMSITAFDSTELSMRGAYSADDLFTAIPNVAISGGEISIRGIGYNTRNIGIESGVAMYVDGVYAGRPSAFDQNLFDTQSFQVLRGPQGSLYGMNSIAGVIDIKTQPPQLGSYSAHALASYGNQSEWRTEGMVNLPVGNDAAFRLDLDRSGDRGWVKDLYNGQYFGGSQDVGGRAEFRWEPTDAVQVTLRGEYFRQLPRSDISETVGGVDPQTPPPRAVVAPGPFTTEGYEGENMPTFSRSASATVDYKVSAALSFTSITGYVGNSRQEEESQDHSANDVIDVDFYDRQHQLTQEFRASGVTGALSYVGGLFYLYQDSFEQNEGILGTAFAIPPLGIPGGVDKVIDPTGTIITHSYAAYFDVTYKLTSALEAELGGRVNDDYKSFRFGVTTQAPALFYAIAPGTDSFSNGNFSPTAALRYHFSDDLMAYVRYAKGYKAGGWNADFESAIRGVPAPTVKSLKFAAENAATTEVGLKSVLLDHRATVDAALFYTRFANLQVAQFNGINLQQLGMQLAATSNAGQATIKGAELEASWLPLRGVLFSAGAGYVDAVYDNFANAGGKGVNAAGKFFPDVPKWTGNVTGQYSYMFADETSIVLRADASYVGRRYYDVLNTPTYVTPAYWFANARLGYVAAADRWQVYLWSNNVTSHFYEQSVTPDQFAVDQSSPVVDVSYGRPRTYGVEFQANF